MVIQKITRDIIKEVAEEFDISYELAREVIYSQFKYTKKEIESATKGEPDTFKNVFLRYFGTFYSSPARVNHLSKNLNKDA